MVTHLVQNSLTELIALRRVKAVKHRSCHPVETLGLSDPAFHSHASTAIG